MAGRLREVIFEFHQVGKALKVSAIDPATMTEVSIVGDPGRSEEALRQTVLKKLEYVLAKDGGGRGR